MIRVLFVDDDPRFLRGVKSVLRGQHDRWDMVFVDSGAEGLREINDAVFVDRPFDVLVSDLRMPQVDGATLLAHARERSPTTIRIALSGHNDLEESLRVVPIAHQFLSKPVGVEDLREAIERSFNLRATLTNATLRQIVGDVQFLPLLPQTYDALTTALANPNSRVPEVAAIVQRDMALSVKILQLVNSAFFGIPRRITSIQHAILYLGMPMIRHLVLTTNVFDVPNVDPRKRSNRLRVKGYSLDYEREHALYAARLARRILDVEAKGDDVFMASMLHDLGKLILAKQLGARYAEIIAAARQPKAYRPIEEVEREFLGVTHAEIGAYLMTLWGLPHPVVEAVAFHHNPRAVAHQRFDVLAAVHFANYLAEPSPGSKFANRARSLDAQYLEELKIGNPLPDWERLAREVRAGQAEALREKHRRDD
jgi:HD-like signal output (HDOD) protein